MAKQALLGVLEQTIGKYVLNLDAESLNVAVWSGTLELGDLRVDADAVNRELSSSSSPLRVTSGRLESLRVDIPWSRLTSRPVVARARGLHLAAKAAAKSEAKEQETGDGEGDSHSRSHAGRDEALAASERYRQQSLAVRKLAQGGEAKSSFASRLLRRIVENLQIEISDVHVRVDDHDEDSKSSLGVALGSLHLKTTDEDGNEAFVDRTSDGESAFLFKSLRILGLGMYVDDRTEDGGGPNVHDRSSHDYVLSPLSLVARMRQADDKVVTTASDEKRCPKYSLDAKLDSLNLHLSQSQLEIANRIFSHVAPPSDGLPETPIFPELRPRVLIRNGGSARRWWKYSYQSIERLQGNRDMWLDFMRGFRRRKRYVPLYKRDAHHEACEWISPLSDEEANELRTIEEDVAISVEGIMSWRNLADAQVDAEREKYQEKTKTKASSGSYFGHIFGHKSAKNTDDNDIPIRLTPEEMKELELSEREGISLDLDNLSSDAQLCGIDLALGAIGLDLVNCDCRPLADLRMGTVSAKLDASTGGAFAFDFRLSDIAVRDRTTERSLFPRVLYNVRESEREDESKPLSLGTGSDHGEAIASKADENTTFHIFAEQTKTGDHKLVVGLVAFEIIASPVLIQALHSFVMIPLSKASTDESLNDRSTLNIERRSSGIQLDAPMKDSFQKTLVSSMNDVFFDADEDVDPSESEFHDPEPGSETQAGSESTVSDGLEVGTPLPEPRSEVSATLFNAWKQKNKSKSEWILDVDLKAPIIIVPESCVNSDANAIVLDLGRLKVQYGVTGTPEKIVDWFQKSSRTSFANIDHGSIAITDLSLSLMTTHTWIVKGKGAEHEGSIIAPVSLMLDFGIETSQRVSGSRICAIGVVPIVKASLSVGQITVASDIAGVWLGILNGLGSDSSDGVKATRSTATSIQQIRTKDSAMSLEKANKKKINLSESTSSSTTAIRTKTKKSNMTGPKLFIKLGIQHISFSITDSNKKTLTEAHIVSVYPSMTMMYGGAMEVRLQMGWFWLLEWLEHSIVMQQRLVAHSPLPLSPAEFAKDSKYGIIEEISKLGAFDRDYDGSLDLADVKYTTSKGEDGVNQNLLEIKMSGMIIHWNPLGIQGLYALVGDLTSASNVDAFNVLVSEPNTAASLPGPAPEDKSEIILTERAEPSRTSIKAEMQHLDVSFNSASDDFPVFSVSMAKTFVDILMSPPMSSGDPDATNNLVLKASLGDLRITTSDLGSTRPQYHSLVSVSEGQSDSLLSVQYFQGPDAGSLAMELVEKHRNEKSKCDNVNELEAYAHVALSQIRVVYLQAQALAIAAYTMDGILGSITTQVAATTVEAAVELANATGAKLYTVTSSGLDVIVPEAAYSDKAFSLSTSMVQVEYHMLAGLGGSYAMVNLVGLSLTDCQDISMVEDPAKLDVTVRIPSTEVGDIEEQAMRMKVMLPSVSFLLSKEQYDLILSLLAKNIGESATFLRDTEGKPDIVSFSSDERPGVLKSEMCMSDIDENESIRSIDTFGKPDDPNEDQVLGRMYIDVEISSVGLKLFGKGPDYPIAEIEAINAVVKMQMKNDIFTSTCDVSLQNVVCDDIRPDASGRRYQTLFNQFSNEGSKAPAKELFEVAYKASKNETSMDLVIGAPVITLIPDVISEVLMFFSADEATAQPTRPASEINHRAPPITTDPASKVLKATPPETRRPEEEEIEDGTASREASKMKFTLKTGACRLMLVDLEDTFSELLTRGSLRRSRAITPTDAAYHAADSIVVQGIFDISLTTTTDVERNETVGAELQGVGNRVEAFSSFGPQLRNPMQILDPTDFEIHVVYAQEISGIKSVESLASAKTDLDLVLSLRDIALTSMILNSLVATFSSTDADDDISHATSLDASEAGRINRLADQLVIGDSSDHSFKNSVAMSSLEGRGSTVATQHTAQPTGPTEMLIRVKATLPSISIICVNDLEGAEEPLLRFVASKLFLDGQVRQEFSAPKRRAFSSPAISDEPLTLFNIQAQTSISADYFNPVINSWTALLVKPWEILAKATRAPNKQSRDSRLSTYIDFELFPCFLSFSEQFLISLANVNRMISLYSVILQQPSISQPDARAYDSRRNTVTNDLKESIEVSYPCAVENSCGIDIMFSLTGEDKKLRSCPSNTCQFFRFQPPPGNGFGGKRQFGQDVSYDQSLTLFVGESAIATVKLDVGLGLPRAAQNIGNGRIMLIQVTLEHKTVILRLTSNVTISNYTSVPFNIAVKSKDEWKNAGICDATEEYFDDESLDNDDPIYCSSEHYSVPLIILEEITNDGNGRSKRDFEVSLAVSPVVPDFYKQSHEEELRGVITTQLNYNDLRKKSAESRTECFDVFCRSTSQSRDSASPFAFEATLRISIVDEVCLCADVSIRPRAVFQNLLPVPIRLQTKASYTFSSGATDRSHAEGIVHTVGVGKSIEIFCHDPALVARAIPAESPLDGDTLNWSPLSSIQLPMLVESSLTSPVLGVFPFTAVRGDPNAPIEGEGNEFVIAQGPDVLATLLSITEGKYNEKKSAVGTAKRHFYMTVCLYAVDKTDSLLIEEIKMQKNHDPRIGRPYSAFASPRSNHLVSLLPSGNALIRCKTRKTNAGQRSMPFLTSDVAISDSGLDMTSILWEDKSESGYFAYRSLINEHQVEIHFAPEYAIYNGSSALISIKERGQRELAIEPGAVLSLPVMRRKNGLDLAVTFVEINARTPFISVGNLGMNLTVVNSHSESAIGSVCIETSIDTLGNAKFVVKIGKFEKVRATREKSPDNDGSFFPSDILRLRARWTRFEIVIIEAIQSAEESKTKGMNSFVSAASSSDVQERTKLASIQMAGSKSTDTHDVKKIASFELIGIGIDYQRMFKDTDAKPSRRPAASPERSQFTLVLHNFLIKDHISGSFVFNLASSESNLLDVCIRIRGPINTDIMNIDLFDVKLAHFGERTGKINMNISEEFIWTLIDIMDRISKANGQVQKLQGSSVVDGTANYRTPSMDMLYDIRTAKVSAVILVVSFIRIPQESRYKVEAKRGIRAGMMNYFTTQLKFSIQNAELKFGKYECKSLKGPKERLIESISAVYISRMKFKIIKLLSASSFQDWKTLAARSEGDNEFRDGDLLRATGHLAGGTVGIAIESLGKGIGGGISGFTGVLGNSIEATSQAVGAGKFGENANSVVSGIGDGVGGAIAGVGKGTGNVMRGTGKGIGKVFGGISGGAQAFAKGVGKGIVGDKRKVATKPPKNDGGKK